MEPTAEIDWSMGSQAARLVDWDTAIRAGRQIAAAGPKVPHPEREVMRRQMSELVSTAETLVTGFTGLEVAGPRSRAWVMGRGDWIRRNILGLERIIEPLAARVLERHPDRSTVARKVLGLQAGAFLGYVSRRVLGQFDVFQPPDDEGLIYFVGPNMVETERRYGLNPDDFRLWIAIHEVTHRVQFATAPWLRHQLAAIIDDYLSSVSLHPRELVEQLKRAAEEAKRTGAHGPGGLLLLLSPAQRAIFERTQAMMSVLEGHATYVMNEVGKEHLSNLPRLRGALAARRSVKGLEKTVQRAIGFDQKVLQYAAGERFVREVAARGGPEAINQVWSSARNLPNKREMAQPGDWIARVLG